MNNVETAFRHYGYLIIFLPILGESAGIPLPGETVLLAGGLAASKGILSLPLVILVGASAAIVGDNLGYLVGRRRRPAAAVPLRPRAARQRPPARHSRQLLRAPRPQDGVLRPLGDLPARLGGALRRRLAHALAALRLLERARRPGLGDHHVDARLRVRRQRGAHQQGLRRARLGVRDRRGASPSPSSSTACRSAPRTASRSRPPRSAYAASAPSTKSAAPRAHGAAAVVAGPARARVAAAPRDRLTLAPPSPAGAAPQQPPRPRRPRARPAPAPSAP